MPDWGAWAEKGLGKLEDGWEEGKRKVGEGVDWATDKVGDGLEHINQDAMADIVEDWGDRAASSLGAKVGEQQLGQSEQANELVHGNVARISASVQNLRDFKGAFDLVGRGMKALDSSRWKGVAADTFREKFTTVPTNWMRASDAFDEAARALETYATTVTWAQGKAQEAIEVYRSGEQASRSAVTAYNKKVDAYKEAYGSKDPLPRPGAFVDPGTAQRDRAQEILADARGQRDEAAGTAQRLVAAALEHAPPLPSATERATFNLADFAVGQGVESTHFTGGVVKGAVGITNFVRSIDPRDPYNLTHPAEYYKSVNMTLAGLASTAAHPDRALKGAWESVKADPSEFIGRLVPELIGTKGAGGGKSLLRAGVKDGAEAAAGRGVKHHSPARADGPGAARHGVEEKPDEVSRGPEDKKCVKDPIDVATGHMVLPQTDISLPGSLPLIFHRSFESSYRGGRWFGPAWASTVDQRLEIDSQGVIFVGDDGSLLAYPHPAPGVPVMPTHGRRWPLDRDPDGNYAVTDPASGRVWHFAPHIGNLALLTQLDDRNGNWITFEYDATGAPSDIVHSGGYHLKLTTHEGRITALYLAGAAADGTDQQIRRYGYTGGHLTEVTNSSGRPLSFGHDVHGRIDSWTDTNGSRFDYVYDEHGRCTSQSGASGHLSATLAYDDTDPDSGLRVTAVTDSLGHTTRYLINERAQVVAEIDPLGAVTRSEYDRHNRLLSRTDPLGRTLLLRYNDAGNLTSVVRPDGRETTAEYNGLGLPVRMTTPDRTSIGQEYDAHGNCVTRTDPSGATTRYIYDEAGHLTTVTDALGSTTRIRSNKAGLPVEVTDPLGAITHIERDAFGRPVTITDPLGSTTCHEWTAEGKPACRIEADGTRQSWTYDGEGNCLTHTDAMGALTQFEYTHFDLMTARTGPDGVRYEFQHDHELRLRRVLNPQGLTWDYEYDEAGRLVAETDFDGRTLSYARDTAGRLTSRTDALGRIIRFERDALDRIVAKDVNGSVTTFEYDLSDQLGQAVGPEARVTFLRDRYGLLKSETVNGQTMTFQYDRLGRRTGRTTPSGAISKWTYDLAGRRSSLTSSGRVLTFEHDAAGREIACHMGDAVTFASGFDALGRLTSQHVTGTDRSIQRRQYAYRADGILTCIHDLLSGSKSFDLDMAGRVTGVHAADWTEHYSYDETGNQTEASWPSSHPGQEARGTRSYNGTAITRAGTVRYEHDALGRITLRQKIRLSRKPETWRYEWDAEDRLAKVVTPDGETWSYAYDPLGRRIAKKRLADDGLTVAEQVTFTWDGAILCEQIHDDCGSSRSVALTWDHDGLCPLAQTERVFAANTPREKIAERFFSIATDLSGAPKELIDESGELAWYTRSTLWGATTWAVKSGAYTPLRFPGQYYDPETGLHYNFFRYYEPETARYLTPDPLGLTPAPNPNTYVNNPNNWVDPLGLGPCRELGLSTGAQRALEKLENIKRDPLGEINSQPNHNHYDAARREANGEVVARKPDGTPFDHIADLKQARNGLDKVRKVIELELKQLPESLTERGLEVLMNKQVEVNRLLNNLNGFLHSIGHR
ncbi:putative T7SS-secreted protein [Streptomyces sp. NBC_01363]|uniref:putative T7SS-secreted protein n=1 Tax=Streptomyces sp. NBC_01363 TaxID=2903840 RepID=UPI002255FC41|nr:polymorphic toxin type 28 domain-containing protein [Streptomyces sp. NBC_01363]MCX4734896.1 polymorphic toxin type 28 domain-containing protein [Streptomyces sp. NBC_01363]